MRQNIEAAKALAQSARPPWEQEGWTPTSEPKPLPGERLKLMWKNIGYDPDRQPIVTKLSPSAKRTKEALKSMKKFKDLRRKLERAGSAVRDEAFEDWINRFVVPVERPDQWTQAGYLYESYLRQAKNYGHNRGDRAISKLELATETRFGILMREAGFIKKRRTKGQFYPLRLKQGA